MAAIRVAALARLGSTRLPWAAFRRQMTTISAAQVKELREATGAPILQCKVALQQPDIDGDFDAAVRWLREQGMGKAAKKASREAAEGLVGVKINEAQNEAVIVEVCLAGCSSSCCNNIQVYFAAEFRNRFCCKK